MNEWKVDSVGVAVIAWSQSHKVCGLTDRCSWKRGHSEFIRLTTKEKRKSFQMQSKVFRVLLFSSIIPHSPGSDPNPTWYIYICSNPQKFFCRSTGHYGMKKLKSAASACSPSSQGMHKTSVFQPAPAQIQPSRLLCYGASVLQRGSLQHDVKQCYSEAVRQRAALCWITSVIK